MKATVAMPQFITNLPERTSPGSSVPALSKSRSSPVGFNPAVEIARAAYFFDLNHRFWNHRATALAIMDRMFGDPSPVALPSFEDPVP